MRDEHQAGIGAQIAHLRERQGWSQRALAKWVGLDQSAVSRIEAGHRRLSAEELHRFADALHVSADVLLKGDFAAPDFAPEDSLALETALADEEPTLQEMVTLPGRQPSQTREPASGPQAPPPARQSARPPARSAPSPAAPLAARESRLFAYAPDEDFGAILASRSPSHHAPARPGAQGGAGLPPEVDAVARDWTTLRLLAATEGPAQRWSTGHSAEGKPERLAHAAASLRPSASAGDVLYDRVARFWRSELHVESDDGPLSDLVPLLEDGYGAQVIVARIAGEAAGGPGAAASSERPVAAAFSAGGVPFIFVNAARPVVLQRFALAHAFAHHVLGHGDVVDRRIEWSRNVPPEAAANDFAEEFLAPVRAVQRWYERRDLPRWIRLEDLLDLGNAFGISVWSALYRSRAAGRLQGKQFHVLSGELKRFQWELLPRQSFLGGLRDTLSCLTPGETLPPRAVRRAGGPARAGRDARVGADRAAGRPPESGGRGRPPAARRARARGAARAPRAGVDAPRLPQARSSGPARTSLASRRGRAYAARTIIGPRGVSDARPCSCSRCGAPLVALGAAAARAAAGARGAAARGIRRRRGSRRHHLGAPVQLQRQGRRLRRRGPRPRGRLLLRRHHPRHRGVERAGARQVQGRRDQALGTHLEAQDRRGCRRGERGGRARRRRGRRRHHGRGAAGVGQGSRRRGAAVQAERRARVDLQVGRPGAQGRLGRRPRARRQGRGVRGGRHARLRVRAGLPRSGRQPRRQGPRGPGPTRALRAATPPRRSRPTAAATGTSPGRARAPAARSRP